MMPDAITIQVQVRQAWGLTRAYAVNDAARHLAAIAGTNSGKNPTLTRTTIERARLIGLIIEVLPGADSIDSCE